MSTPEEDAKWLRLDADELRNEAWHLRQYAHPESCNGMAKFEQMAGRNDKAADRLTSLSAENSRYRRWFGCDSCGEDHPVERICPPHEVRTTGMAWFKSAIRSAEADNASLSAEVARLRQACSECRDAILHGRHHLESALDNDQTNSVLAVFDDTIGTALNREAEG